MNRPNQFQFEWITDWEIILSPDFQLRWLSYYEQAVDSHVFFHPALCKAWIETYMPLRDISPLFCIATQADSIIFFPLVLWKQNWKNAYRRLLVPVGYSDFDYHDPLIINQTKKCIKEFYATLLPELNKVNYDKLIINGITSPGNETNWTKENEICPFCDLSLYAQKDDFLKSLKTSLRGDIKRQIKRLEESGVLSLHKADTAMLPDFLNYHSSRWPGAYKAPLFHHKLLVEGLKVAVVDFTVLKIDDIAISWHLGFSTTDRYYYYLPAINPDYASYSPGKIHLLYLMYNSIDRKQSVFDHLRGDENYKTGWTNSLQELYVYSAKKANVLSNIKNWYVDKMKNRLK